MECRACGNKEARRWRKIAGGPEWCDGCAVVEFSLPDVYVDGKPEWNLPDDPRTGKPPVFGSRIEKLAFLKEHNLVEARGSEHGGPSMPKAHPEPDRAKARHEARLALKHVGEMGRGVRRQEYLRILKERERI